MLSRLGELIDKLNETDPENKYGRTSKFGDTYITKNGYTCRNVTWFQNDDFDYVFFKIMESTKSQNAQQE